MQSRDFCYWLQGFFEISEAKKDGGYEITDEQIDIIRRHLNMVFIHEIDPSFPAHQQQALTDAHEGTTERERLRDFYHSNAIAKC